PGSASSEFRVGAESGDGTELPVPSRVITRPFGSDTLAPRDHFLLGLGDQLPGLVRALTHGQGDKAPPAGQPTRRLALTTAVARLPARWFGYDAVDLLILPTGSEGSEEVVKDLLADSARREALAEWVRRGGRLVVSVGRNQQAAALLDA